MNYGLPPQQLAALQACFARFPAIERVILYGSRAKGTHRPGSDIDLTVVEKGLSSADLLQLENDIDDLLLPWKVDLSLLRQIDNPDLRAHIERVGQVFFAADSLQQV